MSSRLSTILHIVACILLLPLFFLPIWKITLSAPQYPEGLGIHIRIDTITGEHRHDLENINLLNHYIGMKPIRPEEVDELKYMKYGLGALIFVGALAAFTRRRNWMAFWLVLALGAGVAGMVDFYLWGYDYGHNLDPDAPIQIPGMSYQPPLIGKKQLLNITSTSLPHIGGILYMIGIFLSIIGIGHDFRKRAKTPHGSETKSTGRLPAAACLLSILFLSGGCTPQSEPIDFGKDMCYACKMTISDQRYGAELVTNKGKVYKFDSIECMIDRMNREWPEQEFHSLLTVDFANPRQLIPVAQSVYLHSGQLPSPMGMNVSSFRMHNDAEQVRKTYPGNIVGWQEVKELARLWGQAHPCEHCEKE